MKRYFENWESVEDVLGDYPNSGLKDEEVLFAYYGDGCYCGAARVLFQRDGKLYENVDSHCSCSGLESWEPEEVNWEQLGMRSRNLGGFSDEYEGSSQANAAWLALIDAHTVSA
jgi:hypothetical protein